MVVGALPFFCMNNEAITAEEVPTSQRATLVGKLFGVRFLWIESFVFDTAGSLSEQYDGGYWDYFALSNDGFLLVPATREHYRVACANGFEGTMSKDAFGITTCLYTYSRCCRSLQTKSSGKSARIASIGYELTHCSTPKQAPS